MTRLLTLYLSFFSLALLLNIVLTPHSFAASNCSTLYNGGATNKQYCFTPTATPLPGKQNTIQPTPIPKKFLPQQTKGGQKIYPPSKTKATPSTGPEEWSLPALFLIGGMGFWLRKKTKLV